MDGIPSHQKIFSSHRKNSSPLDDISRIGIVRRSRYPAKRNSLLFGTVQKPFNCSIWTRTRIHKRIKRFPYRQAFNKVPSLGLILYLDGSCLEYRKTERIINNNKAQDYDMRSNTVCGWIDRRSCMSRMIVYSFWNCGIGYKIIALIILVIFLNTTAITSSSSSVVAAAVAVWALHIRHFAAVCVGPCVKDVHIYM